MSAFSDVTGSIRGFFHRVFHRSTVGAVYDRAVTDRAYNS